jgi:hypothetical protein
MSPAEADRRSRVPAESSSPDYHLPPQTRWEQADVLADMPAEATDVGEYLRSQGWEGMLTLGDPDGSLWIEVRVRRGADRTAEYLLEVASIDVYSPFLVVDSFPDVMDLVARWAPAVQAAAVVAALQRLEGGTEMHAHGLVESVAARALFGVETGYHQLHRDAAASRRAAAVRLEQQATPRPPPPDERGRRSR